MKEDLLYTRLYSRLCSLYGGGGNTNYMEEEEEEAYMWEEEQGE